MSRRADRDARAWGMLEALGLKAALQDAIRIVLRPAIEGVLKIAAIEEKTLQIGGNSLRRSHRPAGSHHGGHPHGRRKGKRNKRRAWMRFPDGSTAWRGAKGKGRYTKMLNAPGYGRDNGEGWLEIR